MIAQNVAFWIIAVPTAAAAIGVVRSRNVVHAALYLAAVLAGVAAEYLLLVSEFVGWVQVLIYLGAVVVLLLFGVMLTRAPMKASNDLDNDQWMSASIAAALLFTVVVGAIFDAFNGHQIDIGNEATGDAIRESGLALTVGEGVLRGYLIAFEVIGMLLLAAVIGAVALARRDN